MGGANWDLWGAETEGRFVGIYRFRRLWVISGAWGFLGTETNGYVLD